jgi:hypothetical protein
MPQQKKMKRANRSAKPAIGAHPDFVVFLHSEWDGDLLRSPADTVPEAGSLIGGMLVLLADARFEFESADIQRNKSFVK